MSYDRRQILQLGSAATLAALAGCLGSDDSGDSGNGGENGTENGGGNGTENGGENGAENGGENGTENGGENGTENGEEDTIPGRDQLGGPDNLQSSAEVDAITLDGDQGAGQFVNTPAVVWLESGGTVTWNITNGSHSVTAYHPNYDKQMRIPQSAEPFDSGTLSDGETFEHTFEATGVYNYYCRPHEGLGMVGLVIVGEPGNGPGTTEPNVEASAAGENLSALLDLAGIETSGETGNQSYTWEDSTWDSYWYSLYNMSTNIAMSGNGVTFPNNDQQKQQFQQRLPAMLQAANQNKPPVKNPNLNMLPFTSGDPSFTQQPDLGGEDGRPDAKTLTWDRTQSSGTVSPSSVAWTHLKGVTWAKNFEAHFDILPDGIAAEFRSEVLSTLAQIGTKASLVDGGPQGNGVLTAGDDSLQLLSGVKPAGPEVTDSQPRVHHHTAMLWFLSDLVSLSQGGWFGYENPQPLMPPENIQQLADGMFQTTSSTFSAGDIESMRDVGQALAAVGYYGTQAGSDEMASNAAEYANALAGEIDANLTDEGRVENGAENQAATQGIVGQGLLWASEIDGVDHTDTAESVLGYLHEVLWDSDAGTFMSGTDDDIYTITARDAGDIVGGLNAADAVLEMDGIKQTYAEFFNQTFNRGRLQRAERPNSRDENAEYTLPLPPMAGGENGQAAVYNAEVEYDPEADEWSVTDDSFDTEGSLYLANQDVWIGQWGGDFYQGRGRPGHSDEPPA